MTTLFAFIFLIAVAIAASLLIILEQNLQRQDREDENLRKGHDLKIQVQGKKHVTVY